MQKRVLENPHIKIIYSSILTEIKGNGKHVTEVIIKDQKTGITTRLSVDVVFLAIGQKPNTDIFKEQIELDKMGYISLKGGSKTSVDGVFAAGDVADFMYRQAIVSSGSGCMAALDAQRYLEKLGL